MLSPNYQPPPLFLRLCSSFLGQSDPENETRKNIEAIVGRDREMSNGSRAFHRQAILLKKI